MVDHFHPPLPVLTTFSSSVECWPPLLPDGSRMWTLSLPLNRALLPFPPCLTLRLYEFNSPPQFPPPPFCLSCKVQACLLPSGRFSSAWGRTDLSFDVFPFFLLPPHTALPFNVLDVRYFTICFSPSFTYDHNSPLFLLPQQGGMTLPFLFVCPAKKIFFVCFIFPRIVFAGSSQDNLPVCNIRSRIPFPIVFLFVLDPRSCRPLLLPYQVRSCSKCRAPPSSSDKDEVLFLKLVRVTRGPVPIVTMRCCLRLLRLFGIGRNVGRSPSSDLVPPFSLFQDILV